jgi:hypothetical protein
MAIPPRGDAVVIRDLDADEARIHERWLSRFYEPAQYFGPTGPAGIYHTPHMSVSSGGFIATTVGTDPPQPLVPPPLHLPAGWKIEVGQRVETFPPVHGHSPAKDCTCGIYALTSRKEAEVLTGHGVVGEVYLWGEVVQAERGYRAQYAYPKALYPDDKHVVNPEHLKIVSNQYGVPIIRNKKVELPEHSIPGLAELDEPTPGRTPWFWLWDNRR